MTRTIQALSSNVGAQGFAGLGTWRFRTEITEPPASGQIRFNNASIPSATQLWIHDINQGSTDVGNFLLLLDPGDLIYIQDRGDSNNFVVVQVSAVTDVGTYIEVDIAAVVQEGAAFTQNELVAIIVSAAGGITTGNNLQQAYDASAGVPQIVVTAAKPFAVRDAAASIGALAEFQSNDGVSKWELNVGANASRGGMRHLPDDYTQTVLPAVTYALQWDSTITANVAGGGGLGNDTSPAMVGAIGTCVFADQGNVFSSALLFNQGTRVECQANIGPIYTMVNQSNILADGGSFTCSQHNALRIQPRWGANLNGGSITQTSAQYILNVATVDATIGSASVTTLEYWVAGGVTLTAGGTVGTLNAIHLTNIAGPTTIRGIFSEMSNGTFIDHTGTAPALFTAANFRFNDNVGIQLGTGQDVLVNWNGSALEFDPAVGDDWRLTFAAGVHTIQSPNFLGSGAELRFGYDRFAFGQTGIVGNQVGVFVANARSTGVGGEWSDFLLTQAANLTVDHAMGLVAGWTINAPSMTIGTGSVTDAGALNVGGNVNQGSVNRFGIRILSNPSGGSGVNAALWVTAGLSRFDGRVDINNAIALGGGAAATLGTIGGSGPTAAAQATWIEIDVAGVAHWIPAWT